MKTKNMPNISISHKNSSSLVLGCKLVIHPIRVNLQIH